MLAILTSRRSGEISLVDIPEPELNPEGILVRTHFSAISTGTERSTMELSSKSLLRKAMSRPDLVSQVVDYARSNGVRAAYQKVTSKLDTLAAMGYSCAGEVIAVGSEVNEFRIGDRVACAGAGYANHCEVNYVPRNLAVHIPDGVGTDFAALTTIGSIAMQGLRQANIALGETIAIVGAGLLGVLAIQMARAAGCRVIAIDISSERVQKAEQFGANLAVLANDPQLAEKVKAFSRYGVDAAVLTASSSSTEPIEMAAKLMRDRGRIVVVGAIGMGVSRENIYMKELSIVLSRSYGPGRYDTNYEEFGNDYPIGYVRWTEGRNMEAFLDLLETRKIDITPLIEKRYPLDQAASAYTNLSSGMYTAIIEYPSKPSAPRASMSVNTCRTSTSDEVRIGCIGAGSFSTGVIFPVLRAIKAVRFEAVATASGLGAASAKKAFHFGRAETPAEVIVDPNVDAVFIFSRHDSHADYVLRSLKCGKAVFVEKPLATTLGQLKQIEECVVAQAAIGKSIFVMVGFNRRFAPFTCKIREFFAGRTEAMMLNMRINAGFIPNDHWAHRDGGRIVGEFCHFVDWARAVVECPIVRVSSAMMPDNSRYNEDNLTSTLTFADGSLANIQYVANGDKSVSKEYFEVFCDGGVAQLDNFKTLRLARGGKVQKLKASSDKGHQREMELTVKAICSGEAAPIPFSELVEVSKVTFLARESARVLQTLSIDSNTVVEETQTSANPSN